ncbi:MAG: hypothetical protein GXY83_43465 [Rhodopirellula sp.]|nr:hypothetical protein [Rhodopirellula sp.]
MLGRVYWLLLGIAVHIGLWFHTSIAQQAAKPAEMETATAADEAPASAAARGQVREVEPPLWYMKDPKDGSLQPVLGWTPEELEELAQIKLGLKQRDQLPRFSLQWMGATGTIQGDHAELTIDLKVLVRDDRGVRVPLRLNQALLREGAKYEGSGEQFLGFDEKGEGYVSFIRGGGGEIHRLTFRTLVPLLQVGNETRLKLSVPRTTSWELKLKVPIAGAVARVSEGATLLPPEAITEGATELTVLGNGGDLELSWRKQDDPPAELPTVIEAVGEVQVRADGRSIDWEAKLSVRGYGSPMDRFQVRLPKAAELAPINTTAYTVTPVAGDTSSQSGAGPLVEVRLSKKTAAAEEIRIAARMAHEAGISAKPVELAGFEVMGAARQWGHIAVSVAGDWHVRCEADSHVRQVDTLPEWLRSEGLVAGFEYFRQPFSLSAHIIARQTRISVEPEHLLLVEATQVRLETKLKYVVRGAKVFRLKVDLPQWRLDEVGPDNLINADGIEVDKETGVLTIPLAQPSIGQMEVTIRASLAITTEQRQLLLELPRPQAGLTGPAAVVVLPADNVEMTPNAESTLGLVRQQIEPVIKRPQWQQPPWFYRAEGAKAVFAADFRVRSQHISTAVSSQVAVDRRKAQVEQKLTYTVSYEPADRLTLDVPRDLAAAGQLQVSLKDQALSLVDAASQTEQEDALNRMHKSVVLPSACIGPCELIVRYAVELPASATDAGAVTEVPLVVPVDATVTTNSLLLTASENIRLQHRDEHWRLWEGDQAQAPRSQGLRLSAVEPTRSVAFAVQFDDGGKSGSTVVRRAWVQTWLTGASRQDRAVFRFYSTQAQLQIVLPAGVNPEDVEVFLDGDRAVGRPTPYGQLIVPLTPAADPESRQLELSYHFRAVRQGPGSLALELPRLGEDVWTRRVYWELVLPGTEHVIASPGGLTPEFRWDWMGAFWSREPSLDQTALENWVGVQPSAPLPSGANCYLFSSPGIPTRCEIRTATRSLLVLSASGTALVLGLLLIYVPAVRHPVVLLAMVFALAGAAMVYPGPALLAAQAACLGVILTLVACLLQQALRRKRPRATALDRGSSVFFEKGSTQVHHRASPLADHAAPEAAPEAIQVPVSDSHA